MATTSFDFGFKSPINLTKDISEEELFNFRPFQEWAIALKASLASQAQADHRFHEAPYKLRSIKIQSVDRFGPTKIGFVKLFADIRNDNGDFLPGVVFLRGGSVAILMILRPRDSENERWVIMTEQARIPAGSLSFMEIPAGMLDDKDNFAGAAAKEIMQETGFKIPSAELTNLTTLALNKDSVSDPLQSATYLSPGGSDEFITIFLWEKVLDRQEIEALVGKATGVREEGEKIVLRIIKYDNYLGVGARDGKTLAAWALYENYMKHQ
jgi:ADP-sugar diphosphatase